MFPDGFIDNLYEKARTLEFWMPMIEGFVGVIGRLALPIVMFLVGLTLFRVYRKVISMKASVVCFRWKNEALTLNYLFYDGVANVLPSNKAAKRLITGIAKQNRRRSPDSEGFVRLTVVEIIRLKELFKKHLQPMLAAAYLTDGVHSNLPDAKFLVGLRWLRKGALETQEMQLVLLPETVLDQQGKWKDTTSRNFEPNVVPIALAMIDQVGELEGKLFAISTIELPVVPFVDSANLTNKNSDFKKLSSAAAHK